MRILHVDTATEWRGGQNQIVLTALGQSARDHHVTIFANVAGELASRARSAGLNVYSAPVGHGDFAPKTWMSLRRAVAILQPDVIHVHESHGLLASRFAARALFHRPALIASRRVDFRVHRLALWKYSGYDAVLAVSRGVRDVLIDCGMPSSLVHVVHEGVPARDKAQGGIEALRQIGVPEGALVLGNVAQLVDHKDHATFIRAMPRVTEKYPNAKAVICGTGPLHDELSRLAESLGAENDVIFAGFRHDLDALIPEFDVFVLSSRLEGLGTSLLDAMSFSRPIVATAAGGIVDAVEHGTTGWLVPPRDPDQLATALIEALGNEAARRIRGDAGRERFLKEFTDDVMVEATMRAYAIA